MWKKQSYIKYSKNSKKLYAEFTLADFINMNPINANITSSNKNNKKAFEGMPSIIMLIALPKPIPVMNITKLQSAGMVKDLLKAPKIQNIAIVMYRPIMPLKIFA